MDTLKIKKGNVKMIAHRGLSGLEPENSCAAFVAAGNRSYYGIETDVHVTKDGRYVILHDDNTLRTSGTDRIVEESRYEDLAGIRLYGYEKSGTRRDLYIPDLADYIRICRRYGKKAVLELKNTMAERDLLGIIQAIDDENYLSETIFISFSPENLLFVRRQLPEQEIQFLIKNWEDSLPDFLTENRLELDIYYKSLTAERVLRLKEAGIRINVWTCNEPADGEALAALGVDYITSNILE